MSIKEVLTDPQVHLDPVRRNAASIYNHRGQLVLVSTDNSTAILMQRKTDKTLSRWKKCTAEQVNMHQYIITWYLGSQTTDDECSGAAPLNVINKCQSVAPSTLTTQQSQK